MQNAFDNEKYLKIQKEEILKRVESFGNKLYLEVGGKLFDDYHACRVLPGIKADAKFNVLLSLKDDAEIVMVVNSNDINSNKVRNDTAISYQSEVERQIDAFNESGIGVSSVVVSFYNSTPNVDTFITKLKHHKIKVYKHYEIAGYPHDVNLIASEAGLGKNEYIKTTKKLVIVTAPGPGSGKMATCLSQLYHDNKNGIISGYAKFETFPVWNLPLKHPVNLAYEAATVDLNDINMIDPYHLEHYGIRAVNYNRDVETYPLLKALFERISGSCPYNSPTDMGVNMVGFAITDNDAVEKAAKNEIVRRYYQAQKYCYFGKYDDETVYKEKMLMNEVNTSVDDRLCVKAALEKEESSKAPAMALELPDGSIVTGKMSTLLEPSAALLLNALKALAKIDHDVPLLPASFIEPISDLKINCLSHHNPKLHASEVLLALSINANTNPLAALALSKVKELKGLQAHSSVIVSETDLSTLKRLGLNVTEEPKSYASRIYTK